MIDPSLINMLKSKALADELAQANDMINKLIADNSRLNSDLHNKELTVQILLANNARLHLDNSILKGDLSVHNMQVQSLSSECSSLRKKLSAEEARNKEFAEEQIFNANRDKCRIYNLESKVKFLEEQLNRQQQLSVPHIYNTPTNFVPPLAPPPAPPSMNQSTPVKSQPLIPIAIKPAITINVSPSSNTKRKVPEDCVSELSGGSRAGSPARIVRDANKTNGLLIFPLRDATEANRKDLPTQSVSPRNSRATIS